MTTQNKYGKMPTTHGVWDLDFGEYMLYQYLPVAIDGWGNGMADVELPGNLEFARDLIEATITEEWNRDGFWDYIYVTAKRGFATPGNPLNRPGWHTDGFGTEDVNYVWVDKYPTVFAVGDFGNVSDDHIKSAKQFEYVVENAGERHFDITLRTFPDKTLVRLDDTIVHAAPEIPAPGGERSFFKVSFSNEKYNLKGNAHNYGLDYKWEMFDRDFVRNDPARAGRDNA